MSDSKTKYDLIIDKPELMRIYRRILELLITIAGWYVWFILLVRPCIKFYNRYKHYQIKDFLSLEFVGETFYLYELFLGVALVVFLMLLWNRYNIRKFRGKDRRKASGDANSEFLGKYYNIPEKDIIAIQKEKNISIGFLDDNKIVINNDVEGVYTPQDINSHLKNISKS